MRAAWMVVMVAACGGGGKGGDSPDAAASIDAPIDGWVTIADAPGSDAPADASGPCNPLTQAGCAVGEKCNWIYDQLMPTVVAHIGCEPDGTVAVGGACGARVVGPEPCVKGAECVAGECKQICDIDGGAPMCDANHACTRYQNLFVDGTSTVAGVCDPGCDPLTQDLKTGTNRTACGSSDPAQPIRGCYGYATYACAGVAPTVPLAQALTLTDRVAPAGDYLNACAPGYMPFLIEGTGSITAICSGFCAALETDNTPAHVNNAKGDPAALAKLPTASGPAMGNATCDIGKKGSETSSVCKFLWPYLLDSNSQLVVTPTTDTLGVCMATAHYRFDSDLNGTLDANDLLQSQRPCETLPPRSAATTGLYDDAADFGCQRYANSMFTGPSPTSAGSFVIWSNEATPLVRHDFR